jgi:hypothetical protein
MTKDESKDSVNEIIWWVIRESDHVNLKNFWLWENIQDKEVIKSCKEISIKLMRVLSSISVKEIKNSFIGRLSNCWVALEFLLLDKLIRNNEGSENINFEKWPLELDNAKVDFLSSFKIDSWKAIIGNQLTTTESRRINSKNNEIKKVSEKIDTKWWIIDDGIISTSYMPDILSLLMINSHTSEEINKGLTSNNNIWKQAYIEWKKDGFSKWWLSKYLEKKVQNELDLISMSYTEITEEFIRFTKDENLKKPTLYTLNNSKLWFIHIKYDSENWEYEASFYKREKGKQDFIYSLKFYLTNRFLEKIWRKEGGLIPRKQKNNVKKKRGTKQFKRPDINGKWRWNQKSTSFKK